MTNVQRLTAFLYILMRDYTPSGLPEAIMREHVERAGNDEPEYSNPHLYAHARELAERLYGSAQT